MRSCPGCQGARREALAERMPARRVTGEVVEHHDAAALVIVIRIGR